MQILTVICTNGAEEAMDTNAELRQPQPLKALLTSQQMAILLHQVLVTGVRLKTTTYG
jgi:hypothetical protein